MRVVQTRVLLRQRHLHQDRKIGLAVRRPGQERTRLQAERGRSIRRGIATVRERRNLSDRQAFALQRQQSAMKE